MSWKLMAAGIESQQPILKAYNAVPSQEARTLLRSSIFSLRVPILSLPSNPQSRAGLAAAVYLHRLSTPFS